MDKLPAPDILFNNAACGLLLTTTDGTICAANVTFCHWIGYASEDLVGKIRIQHLFTMGGRVFHHTHWSPLLQMQNSVSEVQINMVHRDGQILPMLVNAVRRQHGSVAYDELAVFIVKDRKLYEKELLHAQQTAEASLNELQMVQGQLQESRQMLGLAMRAGRMGVWSLNLSTKPRVWWLSRELEDLLGIPEATFDGSEEAFSKLLHEDDRAQVYESLETTIATGSDYAVEFRLQDAIGQWKPLEARGRITYDEKRTPHTLIGVVIDASERRRAESRLRELNEQLSAADRRKNEFLATLAHELRNPMAPICNVLEVLNLKDLRDPQLLWARDVLVRQTLQMTHLIDDLLDVSRITHGRVVLRKQPIDFVGVIHDALDATKHTVEAAQHQLSLQLPSEPIVLDADAVRLTQIVSNLLTNAAKYTPIGGQIHLQLERQKHTAELKVRDTGIGIGEDELERVFNMFSQLTPALERAQGGLGIGLALVRGLVELHGGTIRAESEGLNKGSTFIVRLPTAVSQHQLTNEVPTPLSMVTRESRECRVLVIDDNTDSAETMASVLSMLNYTTSTADSGLAGLKAVTEFSPDVVLLDIGLPDVDGYEVARRIRKGPRGAHILLVAVTGWGQADDINAAKEAGFDQHLTKPVDFEKLTSVLDI